MSTPKDWQEIYRGSLDDPDSLASVFSSPAQVLKRVISRYPARINPHYLSLIDRPRDAIYRQVFPDQEELSETNDQNPDDPIGEDVYSPVANLSHRYRDRVLFLVSDTCPVFCRFCTRKRKVGRSLSVTEETLEAGFRYIEDHRKIRDVLLSGGDPLMLPDERLARILDRVRRIPHVEVIRIGTRVPAALPQRITPKLVKILRDDHPAYIHTHFNHPREITPESREACRLMADAGLPMSNQTVLLKGINDDADTLEELFRGLLNNRVRPYYLFQVDLARGVDHFRTPLASGLDIMDELHRRTSPMALPTYVVDLPDAKGKVVLNRGSVLMRADGGIAIRMPTGEEVAYPEGDRPLNGVSDPRCLPTETVAGSRTRWSAPSTGREKGKGSI
jgi:lysine 2,3-aminomutase